MDILCYDVLCHIFEYVEIGDTLIDVRLISKQFDYIVNDNLLWKCYYNRDYCVKHLNLNILSKKEAYNKCHEICILKQKLKMDQLIFNVMNLQELYLQSSNTTIIPKQIKYLVNLRNLWVPYNKIMEIPTLRDDLWGACAETPAAYPIPTLRKDLWGACAETPAAYPISKEIKYLVNLQEMYLSNNKIMEIPMKITNLVNLRILSLQSNIEVRVVIPIENNNILSAHDCSIHI